MVFAAFALLLLAAAPAAASAQADPIGDKLSEVEAGAKPAPKPERRTRRGREPQPARAEPARPAPVPAAPAVLTVAALVGADEAGVRAKLGEPAIAWAEGEGALWTYRLPRCALFVQFRRQGALRVTGATTGPLARGSTPPAADACLADRGPSA